MMRDFAMAVGAFLGGQSNVSDVEEEILGNNISAARRVEPRSNARLRTRAPRRTQRLSVPSDCALH